MPFFTSSSSLNSDSSSSEISAGSSDSSFFGLTGFFLLGVGLAGTGADLAFGSDLKVC